MPFFKSSQIDLTLIYKDSMNQNSFLTKSISRNGNRFYLGITNSLVATDPLNVFNFLRAIISTSWNSIENKN
jgi:hypothetical protein